MPKILVVDDDPDLVETVSMMLESNNYEVVAAYGGKEGLEKVRTENPDAVVLDVMMPDLDGFKVCEQIKGDPKLRDIPVLLLTAVASQMHKTKYNPRMGMETEADDYVDKPVEPDEIIRRVEKLLAR